MCIMRKRALFPILFALAAYIANVALTLEADAQSTQRSPMVAPRVIDKIKPNKPLKPINKCPYVDIELSQPKLEMKGAVPGGFRAMMTVRARNIGSRSFYHRSWYLQVLNGTHVVGGHNLELVPDNKPGSSGYGSSPVFTVQMGEFTADLTARAILTSSARPTDGDCNINMANNSVTIPRADVQRILMSAR